MDNKKISLCLAGGGIKGVAHIGVLKVLEEENIEIEYIGGTSSGSIVSSLYAAGFSADEIYYIFKKYCKKIKYANLKNILKLIYGLIIERKIIIDGLNSGKEIEKLINKESNKKGVYNISDIKKPLVIPSVNMNTGEVICFTSCSKRVEYSDKIKFVDDISIGKAVRASCSYPVVFSPCEYRDMELIDGGIRENVPWKELELLGAKNIVNVIFESDKKDNCCDNLIEVAGRSIDLLCRELSNYEMQGTYKILKIKTEKTGLLDISKLENLYYLGYKQAKEFF
jgi:NTE family protein